MRSRFQALPRRYDGIQELEKGTVLVDELDPELQALSAEASRELRVPLAAVSLLHEEVTFLRGYFGFPQDVRVNPRDESFCQVVVRDNMFLEVNDAKTDDRVPQAAVDKFGVASYLGAPIVLAGRAVGAMCVVDTEPRLFDDRERGVLHRIAARASKRLALLAAQPRQLERTLHDRAVRPAFAEIRNRLQPVLGNISMMQVKLSDILLAQRLLRSGEDPNRSTLRGRIDEMLGDVATYLQELRNEADAVHGAIVALERASLTSDGGCFILDVIGPATTLAHHLTKLVEGVTWTGECHASLTVPRSVAVNTLAAALAGLAESIPSAGMRGIKATISGQDSLATVELRADVPARALGALANQLSVLVGDASRVRAHEHTLQLDFETTRSQT